MSTTASPAIGVPRWGASEQENHYKREEMLMNLLRSMCCFFSRCAEEEPKPTTDKAQAEASGDLGQGAEREKAEKDQLGHMVRQSNLHSGPQRGCT